MIVTKNNLVKLHHTTLPSRIRNYYYTRTKGADGVPWLRIDMLPAAQLARPRVLVNGAFDLLTASHMRLLSVARDKAGPTGTVLIALDSDEKVAKAKGASRPVMTFIERATTLGYMPIDALVEVGSDEDMRRLVATLAPDLRVQGAEYAGHATRFPHVCRCFVPDTGLHTSDIIARIRQQS